MKVNGAYKVAPLIKYNGAKYPTLTEMRKGFGKISKISKIIFSILLGVILTISRKGETADKASWTFEPLDDEKGITHPILGVYYATACYSGPIWDPMNMKEAVSLEKLITKPAKYKNKKIKTKGVLKKISKMPFGEANGYCLSEESDKYRLWIFPRERNPIDFDHKLVGQEVTVIGEIKLYSKKFLNNYEGFKPEYIWGISLEGIEPMTKKE